jgi:hypothetical protein
VIAATGIKVYLYDRLSPTPLVPTPCAALRPRSG